MDESPKLFSHQNTKPYVIKVQGCYITLILGDGGFKENIKSCEAFLLDEMYKHILIHNLVNV